jgi:hypothetical protein
MTLIPGVSTTVWPRRSHRESRRRTANAFWFVVILTLHERRNHISDVIQEDIMFKCTVTGSPSLLRLLFCLAHQWEHFSTRLSTWHTRSCPQNETLCARLWLDVFWTLCACQILKVSINVGHALGNVSSKVKTNYLPKSAKVSFSFCPWQGGLGVGWVGSEFLVERIGMFPFVRGNN